VTTKWGLVGNEKDTLIDETEISVAEWLEYCYYSNAVMDSFYLENRLNMAQKTFLLSASLPQIQVARNYESIKQFISNPSDRILKSFDGLRGTVYLPISRDAYKVDSIKNKLVFYLSTPITNITFEQVISFCKWRSGIDELVSRCRKIDYFFQYTLPSKDWCYRLIPKNDSVDYSRNASFNYRYAQITKLDKKDAESVYNYRMCGKYPMSIFSFKHSIAYKKCKLYNLRGNVAEMTSEKGIAFGGSYFHSAHSSNANNFQKYESSEEWLGFRCIAVKIGTTTGEMP
jgi:hypothetical protein